MLSIMNMHAATASGRNERTSSIRPPKIHIVIVMGKPKYDCEVFPGMCVFLYGTFDRSNPLSAGTYSTYENHSLQIEIQKAEISESLNKKLSETDLFDLDEEYQIPADISRDLGSENPLTLTTGKYNIIDAGDSFLLTIGCH